MTRTTINVLGVLSGTAEIKHQVLVLLLVKKGAI
jgi:hypothetical protein